MALSWEVDAVKDKDHVCFDAKGELKTKTEALIFATMAIDIGEITAKNVDEFWERLELWEKVSGTFLKHSNEEGIIPIPFTRADVVAHVGLRTNVTKRTRRQFMLKLGDVALEKLTGKRFLLLR